jgi:hypothetical protein
VAGRKAAEVTFTYKKSIAGEMLKQRLLIVMKDDDVAIYVAAQAQEKEFDNLSARLFEPVFHSLNL